MYDVPMDVTKLDLNNQTNFDMRFIRLSKSEGSSELPGNLCEVVIQDEVSFNQEEKDKIIAEHDGLNYYCPPDGLQLQGSFYNGEENMYVLITPTAEGEANGAAD